MNPPADFKVSISGATRELLIRLHERAASEGLRAEFLAALQTIVSRLQTDPVGYGEEVFDLRVMHLTIKVGVGLLVAVEFGVYLERREVLVRTFGFVPPGK